MQDIWQTTEAQMIRSARAKGLLSVNNTSRYGFFNNGVGCFMSLQGSTITMNCASPGHLNSIFILRSLNDWIDITDFFFHKRCFQMFFLWPVCKALYEFLLDECETSFIADILTSTDTSRTPLYACQWYNHQRETIKWKTPSYAYGYISTIALAQIWNLVLRN